MTKQPRYSVEVSLRKHSFHLGCFWGIVGETWFKEENCSQAAMEIMTPPSHVLLAMVTGSRVGQGLQITWGHGQGASQRMVSKKRCPVTHTHTHTHTHTPQPEHAFCYLYARWEDLSSGSWLYLKPNRRSHFIRPGAPVPWWKPISGVWPPACGPQHTDHHDVHKLSLILASQQLSVGLDFKDGFRVTVNY